MMRPHIKILTIFFMRQNDFIRVFFIYFNYILMIKIINLLSVLPHDPIEDCDNGSIFYIFLLFLLLFFKIISAFVPISWGFVRDFFILILFFNFIFILKLKKNFLEFRDFAAYTKKLQSYEKIAYRHLREEKTCPNMRCYGQNAYGI